MYLQRDSVNNGFERYKCIRPTLKNVSMPFTSRTRKRVTDGRVVMRDKATYQMAIPCGCCVNCRRKQSTLWAQRMAYTMYQTISGNPHGKVYFVTLTYNDSHLPKHILGTNVPERKSYKDVQNLLKKLRNPFYHSVLNLGSFRYFCVGEFGKRSDRFHYHMLIYVDDYTQVPRFLEKQSATTFDNVLSQSGRDFLKTHPQAIEDKKLCRHYVSTDKRKQKRLQTSDEVSLAAILQYDFWKKGNVDVGACQSLGGCFYLAKYTTKSQDQALLGYVSFHRQSVGLAADFYRSKANDIYAGTYVFTYGEGNSQHISVPRHYIHKYGNLQSIYNYMWNNQGKLVADADKTIEEYRRLHSMDDQKLFQSVKSEFDAEFADDIPDSSYYDVHDINRADFSSERDLRDFVIVPFYKKVAEKFGFSK